MYVEIEAIRYLITVTLFTFVAMVVGNEPVSGQQRIEFEGKQWAASNADRLVIQEYRGRTALHVQGRPDTFVYLPGIRGSHATIEVDIAVPFRSVPGIGFSGSDDGKRYDKVIFNRRVRTAQRERSRLDQAVITRNNGTLILLNIAATSVGDRPDLRGWFHAKVIVQDQNVKVYLNEDEELALEVGGMIDGNDDGTLGMCGGDFYFSNFRYTVH